MLLLDALVSRKLGTEEQLYQAALRALMRRAHSVHEMRKLLARRAEDASLIRPVIENLKQRKYLDDARYARDFAQARARSRRQGRFRIARELRARGVPDPHIEAALESVFAETDEATLLRARLKRALAQLRGALDDRKRASLYRSLLRAGFSSDAIRAELRAVSSRDFPETLDLPSSEDD